MLPRTIDGMEHVCYFRHALALDEQRVKFLPEYAYGGASTKPDGQHILTIGNGSDKDNVPLSANGNSSSVNPLSLDGGTSTVHNEAGTYDVPPSQNGSLMTDNGSAGNTLSTRNEDIVNHLQLSKDAMGKRPHTLEVWFAGTHSDM
jgi:hypothetical protein